MEAENKAYLAKLKEAIDKNWDDQMKTLREIITIRSVDEGPRKIKRQTGTTPEGEPVYETLEAPFGEGVQKVFEYALKKGEELGFDPVNVDNYGGHVELPGYTFDEAGEMNGTAEEIMGIVGHLDVVPEGDGWSADPYTLRVEDGRIYGRGTSDDKGPVVASLYAMKAIADAGFTPHANVRCIFGLDEETNWSGMIRYLESEKQPDFGFTPDGDFPVIHGEKGVTTFELVRKLAAGNGEGLQLTQLSGGSAANMVADSARAVLLAKDKSEYDIIRGMAENRKAAGDMDIATRIMGKSMEVSVKGVSAHGATPEKGVNAISQLMEFLGGLNFGNDDVNEFVAFYNDCIGYDLGGERLGIGFEDETSGKMVVNVGLLSGDKKSVTLTLCCRCPISVTDGMFYDGVASAVGKYDVGIIKGAFQPPLYLPKDHPMIRTMMDIYREHTGDMESEPLLIGGATYARALDNIVAFGALFPGREDRMHQADEYFLEEDFKMMTIIFADTIYRLAVAKD